MTRRQNKGVGVGTIGMLLSVHRSGLRGRDRLDARSTIKRLSKIRGVNKETECDGKH